MKNSFKMIAIGLAAMVMLVGCTKLTGKGQTKETVFGTVSSVVLEPALELPAKYKSYQHAPLTEAYNSDITHSIPADADAFAGVWIRQAAAVEDPDWQLLAAIDHAESVRSPDKGKVDAAIALTKKELSPNKITTAVFGMRNEQIVVAGPDSARGEYYVSLILAGYASMVAASDYEHNVKYRLVYVPAFAKAGIDIEDRSRIDLTVKVPVERRKEIEQARDHARMIARVYGHPYKVANLSHLENGEVNAGLNVDVEGVEFGVWQGGAFKTLFFVDTPQLAKLKS